MGRPRNSEREDVRTLILEQAKKLFYAEGYGRITIRKIARAIGYSPATIYLYFKSKDEILYELHNEGFRLLYSYKMKMVGDGPADALDRLNRGGRMYVDFALENPEYYELMFNMPEPRDFMAARQRDGGEGSDRFGDYAMRSYDFLKESIANCVAEGFFQEVDLDTAAFVFWSFVHGLVTLIIRKRIPYSQAPTRELGYKAIDLFMALQGPPKAKSGRDPEEAR